MRTDDRPRVILDGEVLQLLLDTPDGASVAAAAWLVTSIVTSDGAPTAAAADAYENIDNVLAVQSSPSQPYCNLSP